MSDDERLRRHLATVLETAADAVVTVDRHLHVVDFNRGAVRLLGYERHEALGMPLSHLLPAAKRDGHDAHVRAFGANGVGARLMGRNGLVAARHRDGREVPVEVTIAASGNGEAAFYTAVLRDGTLHHRVRQLERERLVTEASSLAKSDLLVRASHELRTPLNAIVGFADLAASDVSAPVPEVQAQRLALIRRSAQHLLAVVDHMLDAVRIERGTVAVTPETMQLAPVLFETVAMLRADAEHKQLAIGFDVGPESSWVRADPRACRQVVLNLLSNAIKYSSRGGRIDVHLTREAEALVLRVRDHGRGLTDAQRAALFKPFGRVGETNAPGLGLGLAISHELARAMGGELTSPRVEGAGAAFDLRLPAADEDDVREALRAIADRRAGSAAGRRLVLNIDADPFGAMRMEQIVLSAGAWTFWGCNSAADGVRAALETQPQVIVIDADVADLPWIEVVARLRADPRTRASRIAVLADAPAESLREQALSAGAEQVWSRPVEASQVWMWLATLDTRLP